MIIFKIMKRYIILKHIPYYLQVPIFIYLVFSNIPFLQSLIAQDFLTIKKKDTTSGRLDNQEVSYLLAAIVVISYY